MELCILYANADGTNTIVWTFDWLLSPSFFSVLSQATFFLISFGNRAEQRPICYHLAQKNGKAYDTFFSFFTLFEEAESWQLKTV